MPVTWQVDRRSDDCQLVRLTEISAPAVLFETQVKSWPADRRFREEPPQRSRGVASGPLVERMGGVQPAGGQQMILRVTVCAHAAIGLKGQSLRTGCQKGIDTDVCA